MLVNQRLPRKMGKQFEKVEGDKWALIRWSLRYGPLVDHSDSDLGSLLSEIPGYLSEASDERLAVCQVFEWLVDTRGDPTDYIPYKLRTLYEIEWYADPDEGKEE